MKAKRDRLISILKKKVTKDPDYGNETVSWVPFASRIWAEVQDELPSKSESVKQGVRVAARRARVRLLYRPNITSDMRIQVHDSTEWTAEIVGGPAEMGRREGIEMMIEAYSS